MAVVVEEYRRRYGDMVQVSTVGEFCRCGKGTVGVVWYGKSTGGRG